MARFRFLLARFKPTTLLPLGDLLLVGLAILLALQLWAMRDGQESIAWDFILSHVYWVLGPSAFRTTAVGGHSEKDEGMVSDGLLRLPSWPVGQGARLSA